MSQDRWPRWLVALDRWYFTPAPALRVAVLRVLVIGFSLAWLIGLAPLLIANVRMPARQFAPVGVVSILDAPLAAGLVVGVWLVSVAAGVAAVLGWRWRVSGPLFALGLLWVTSYRNSWGMVFHSENLVVMHALVLALLPAADAWSLDARRSGRDPSAAMTLDPRYGWGPKLMATITALAYVLAGVAKLRNAGHLWLEGEVLLGHVAWDNLRKIELGAGYSPLGAVMSTFPIVFIPLAWTSVVLELGAPLALLGRRLAWIWAIGMWLFHVGVLLIMAIMFAYPVSGIAFAPLFAVELPLLRLADRIRAKRPGSRLLRLLPEVSCPSA